MSCLACALAPGVGHGPQAREAVQHRAGRCRPPNPQGALTARRAANVLEHRGNSSGRGRTHSPFLRVAGVAVDADSSLWLYRAAVKRLLGGLGDSFCGEPSTASGERREKKGRVRRKNESDERNERKRGRGCVIIIDTAAYVLMRAAENGPAVPPPLLCRCSAFSHTHSLCLFPSPFFFLSIFSFVNLLNSTLCACVGCVHMREYTLSTTSVMSHLLTARPRPLQT